MPLKRVQDILTSKHLDAFLVSSHANVSYLSGFYGFSHVERDAYVLVTKNVMHLFTNPLYADSFRSQSLPFSLKITSSDKPFKKQLHGVFTEEQITSVGFEEDNLTVAEFSKVQKDGIDFIPETLSHLRIFKLQNEISQLQDVCKLTDSVLTELLTQSVIPGITEKELAKRLEIIVLQNNAGFSFPVIMAFGKNAAVPHHHTGETKLQDNDLILIDFGLKLNNYCSDITRTFFIGKPTNEQIRAYETVLSAQKKAIEHLTTRISERTTAKKTVKASDVDKVAREYIISQGYPSIPHSLGHGIGLEVHEAPSLSPFSDDVLVNDMVFSIEPGIYLPGKFGIRIEDLFAIQDGKLIQLTNAPSNMK